MDEPPKYAYPYPAQGQGYYQGPPVQAPPPQYYYPYPAQGQGYYQGPPIQAPPPQYYAAPPPRRETGFLEGCLAAVCRCCPMEECCCCLIDECCCDPSIFFEFSLLCCV